MRDEIKILSSLGQEKNTFSIKDKPKHRSIKISSKEFRKEILDIDLNKLGKEQQNVDDRKGLINIKNKINKIQNTNY